MSEATRPARRTPSRKSAGSRKRSDPNMGPRVLLRRSGFARRAHLVADAPHRDDRRPIAELAAQLAHMHVDRARLARERIAPDASEQLIASEDKAAVVEQLPQQIELLWRQLDFLLCD